MTDDATIELISDQQQHSSALTQNSNGNDRSLTSTAVGAQENFIPIILLFEMVARILGVVACGWVVLVVVQGGMVGTVETKDLVFVTVLFFSAGFRCWPHYCPQAPGSLTEATQSLSADYLSIPNNIQQLAVPICFIHRLFYWFKLVSAIQSVVLSVMQLASQDFGKKEVANKESRDFTLKLFYGLALAEALVFLFPPTLSFLIMGNSVGLADGPGDDPEDGPGNGPEDGPGNGPGDGPEDGPGDGPEDGPGDGPEDSPGDGPEYGPGDGPVNQSNECNGVAQMDRPANQSNDFNSEGPADSLHNLRQRRREIPQHSSALIQNNNGNDKSLRSTSVGAQEKSIPITDLLEKVAKMLGLLACWLVLMLVQAEMVNTVETKDLVFITMLFFLVCFHWWRRHYCPQAPRPLTEATQSLSTDYLSIPNNIQQLAVSIGYINILFYWSKLVTAVTSVVLSVMRLASQDFGKKEVANKEYRDFALKVFYVLTLAEALVLLFAEALSFPMRRNSGGLADGPGDGPEDGPGGGPEDSPGDGPEYGPGDGPVNQSIICNGVAQMDRPANQSNDFNSEGPADSLPNLRQRPREIPKSSDGDSPGRDIWRVRERREIFRSQAQFE